MENERKKIINVRDLRDDLLQMYMDCRDGRIGLSQGKTESSIAGKILSSAKIQMEYNKFTSSSSKVQFLESDS